MHPHLSPEITMSAPIQEVIIGIVARGLHVAKQDVQLNSSLREELGADSLTIVEIAMALEQSFKVEIPDADTRIFRTVAHIVDYIQSKITNDSTV